MVFLIPILAPILFPIALGSTFLDVVTGQMEFAGSVWDFFRIVFDLMGAWL